MGLDEEICRQNLVRILEQVKKCNNFLRIDMEDTPYTDITISLVLFHVAARVQRMPGRVGCAILSLSHRSRRAQITRITDTHLRLVKGAYKEPSIRHSEKSGRRMRTSIC